MAEISFDIENVDGKELDDIAVAVLQYLYDELGYTVSNWWVEL